MAVQLPSIESIPLVTPQADRPGVSFGGAEQATQELAGAVSGLGEGLKNQADFIQDVRNENTARDASVNLGARMGQIWSDYSQKEGKAAVDAYPDFVGQLQAARKDALDGAPNLAVQNMLGQQATYMVDRWQIAGGTHQAEGMKQWTSQSYLGTLEDASNQAAHSWTDPDFVGGQLARGTDAAKSLSALHGEDAETATANAAKAADQVLEPAIKTAAATNPTAAQALLTKYGPSMSGPGLARVTEELKAGERQSGIASGIATTMATPLEPGNGLPAGSPVALDAGTRARAQDVHDIAVKQGAPDDEAWGWAANAVHESGANAAPPPGDGGISHGLFQLNKDQLAAYQAQHAGHLPEQDDVATQLQFARSQAAPSLTGARGPGGYAAAISTGFEVPKGGAQEAANRAATAQALAGGGSAPVGPAPGFDAAGQPLAAGWQNASATTGAQSAAGAQPGQPGQPPSHDPAPYGIEFQRMQIARTQAAQKFPNDQLAQREWVDGVWQQIQQTNVMQAKYEAEQAKALRDGQQAEGQAVFNSILKDPAHFDTTLLSNAKYLTWEQKNDLSNIAQKHFADTAGGKESLAYGPGFWSAYQQVHSSDPAQKINDPSQLWGRGGPNGDLSLAGIDKLTQEISSSRTPEGAAYAETTKSYLASAHVAISGHGMMGGQRDSVGEMNFTRFLPAAFAEMDKERQAGESPGQMMAKDGPLMKLVDQYKRSPAQMMHDMLGDNNPDLGAAAGTGTPAAGAGTPATGAAPAPKWDLTTPAGVNDAYRRGYFGVGQAAYDAAAGELLRRGFVRDPNAGPPAPAVPTGP
jgi:hypothetical protein